MSSGHVVAGSAVKIVDHGPDSARWNMVILPEGYTPPSSASSTTTPSASSTTSTPPRRSPTCGAA